MKVDVAPAVVPDKVFFDIFRSEDLLSYDDMKSLKTSVLPNVKAGIVGKPMKKYCVISDQHLYLATANKIYEKKVSWDVKLKVLVTQLLQASYENLSEAQQDGLRGDDGNGKLFVSMMNNTGFKLYYEELVIYLTDDQIKFDEMTNWQLHFTNGYLDLKTKQFQQRDISKDYVTRYINREYKPSSKKDREYIMNILSMIYPKQEDRDFVLSQFGRAFSGTSDIDQVNLFLLGDGSTSKSFIMKLIQNAVEDYLFELSSNTFELGNKDVNKILNTFGCNPIIRIAWVNELSDKKIDDALFKTFCEGRVKTTKLYKEGNHDIDLHCKLILTSNDMPSIKIDTGTSRRIISYQHMSKFVDNEEDVDEDNHVYLKNKHLLNEIKLKHRLLNAIVDILADYCFRWHKGESFQEPESVRDSKHLIVSLNDIVQDFIDKTIEITNDEEDRIGKNEMREMFIKMYPNKHMTVLQLLSSLKQKGIMYGSKFRCGGVQGCYYGVKAKVADQDSEEFTGPYAKKALAEDNTSLREENKKLKNKIKELEKRLNMYESSEPSDEEYDDNESMKMPTKSLFKKVTTNTTYKKITTKTNIDSQMMKVKAKKYVEDDDTIKQTLKELNYLLN